jgi:hypothetical protein
MIVIESWGTSNMMMIALTHDSYRIVGNVKYDDDHTNAKIVIE